MAAEDEKPRFQRQIITIAGEAVSFTPTGFPKGEQSIVQFQDYYIPPDMSASDQTILESTMRELFGSNRLPVFDTESQIELPKPIRLPILPPCDIVQKKIVLQSLQYRFDLLRQELNSRGVRSFQDLRRRIQEIKELPIGTLEGKDTLDVRRNIRHFQALKQLIDDYNTKQQCVSISDKAFGELELDLTDDLTRELLKQFIFFTLQAHHPLQDFKNTNPTAPAFIKRLEVNPIGDKFDPFLNKYKENKFPIPESIGRVLEAVSAEPGALDAEVKRQVTEAIEKEKGTILEMVLTIFPEGDPFWRRISDKKNLNEIIDRLLEIVKDARGIIKNLQDENADLKAKVEACKKTDVLLRTQLIRLRGDVVTLQEQLRAAGNKDEEIRRLQESLAKAQEDIAAKQARLAAEAERYARDMAANEAAITRVRGGIETYAGEVEALRREVARLEDLQRRAETDIAGLREALATEQGKTETERVAKVEAERQRTEAVRELTGVRAELAARDATIAANREQINELTRELRACNDAGRAQLAAMAEKDAELERLRAENATLQAQKRALEEQLRKLLEDEEHDEEEIARLKNEIATLSGKVADLTAALKACEAEKASLKAGVDAPRLKAAELEASLEKMRGQLDAATGQKELLMGQIKILESEVKRKDEAIGAKNNELASMTAKAESAQGQVRDLTTRLGVTSSDLAAQRELVEQQQAKAREDAEAHERRIADLTRTFRGQLEAKDTELAAIKPLQEELAVTRKEVEKRGEAYEIFKKAVEALLVDKDPNEAFAPVENSEAKDTLQTIFTKLQGLSRAVSSSSAPSSPKAKRSEQLLTQCNDVFMLTFLWDTNFPTGDAESQKLYTILNTLFSSGPYPGDESRSLSGLYEGSPGKADSVLGLFKKLVPLFTLVGAPEVKGIVLSKEEFDTVGKLLDKMRPIEEAYKKIEDAELAGKVTIEVGEKTYLAKKARENLTRHNPFMELPYQYLKLVPKELKIETTTTESTKLSYPVVFYCFMIVLRDYLNNIKNTLEGQCPLPTIIRKA